MEKNKIDLILKHFIDFNEINFVPQKKYEDIYVDEDVNLKNYFIYFHQNFNSLLEFMNQRGAGSHYTANESRELIYLIDKIREFYSILSNTQYAFSIDEDYLKWMDYCDGFLSQSGGSEIPLDYKRTILKNYEKIFFCKEKSTGIIPKDVKYKLIGQGAYAKVFSFKEPISGRLFALKKLNKDIIGKEIERFTIEYKKMNEINNPYILKAYKYNQDDNSYVMEYCDYTLEKYIDMNNNKEYMTESFRKGIALQFLKGLKYLHSKELFHRDLSFRNILIKEYDDNFLVVKLSDFGLIKDINLNLTSTGSEIRGTIVDDTLTNFKDYNIKHEIYAVGVILWFIFTGKHNLSQIDDSSIGKIVTKCVERNHSKRYDSVDEIITDIIKMNKSENTSKNNVASSVNTETIDIDEMEFKFVKAMVEDKSGNQMLYIKTLSGESYQSSDGKFLIDLSSKTPRERIYIKESFDNIISKGYIHSINYKNDIYELTKSGYEYYDVMIKNV